MEAAAASAGGERALSQATLDSMSLLDGASAGGWRGAASEAENAEADRVAVLEFELRDELFSINRLKRGQSLQLFSKMPH